MGERRENSIQSAIAGALQVYCQERDLHIFPPYANQQGERIRQYCGDILGVLENADLIALEIKQLEFANNTLIAFDEDQHKVTQRLEEIGVPLAYAYNAVEVLPYHKRPQPKDWDSKTLQVIKRSQPTLLPGPTPHANRHQSLLDWINGKHTNNGTELFGRLHGAIDAVHDLRNGILILLYSQNKLELLSSDDILWMVSTLSKSSSLSARQRTQIELILGESAKVFEAFFPPKPEENQVVSKRPGFKK